MCYVYGATARERWPILYVADCILMSRQNYFRFDVVIKKVVNNIDTYAKFAFITTVPVENK